MALLKIIEVEEDSQNTLRKKSRPVTAITPRVRTLIEDMKETLKASGGVGLAAPQVGVLTRAVVVDDAGEIRVLLNPEIVSREGEYEDIEACLSVPGKWGLVKRPESVVVRAKDMDGVERTLTGAGLMSRCYCHEIDHLNGVLYTDLATRMLDPSELE